MRLHDRYLFRELFTPLAVCLGVFLIFWVFLLFSQELEHIRDAKLHFVDTIEYGLSLMPAILIMVMPFILLFGLLWALSNHARHNELTALRAAGISLWRICVPYFVVGLLATGAYFVLNEIVAPACDKWSASILTRYVKKTAATTSSTHFTNSGYTNHRAQRVWKFGEFHGISGTMINPVVIWYLPDGREQQLKASTAIYTNDTWVFFDVNQYVETAPHSGLVQLSTTNELALPDFDETPQRILMDLKFTDKNGTLSTRSADVPLFQLWPYLQSNPDLTPQEHAKLFTKFYSRIAAPWTCFIVVLMAIPFGAPSGRRNLFYGVAGAIFISFAFFVLQQVSIAFGLGGHMIPWVAAWLPNIIFALLGFFLTLRVR